MAENTKIEWADHTFNPWMGCAKVSPACQHCYAERDMDHRYGKVNWGHNGTRVKTSVENWSKPLRWNREAEEKAIRYRVFCASLADVFEDWKGPIINHHGRRLSNATFETASTSSGDLTMDDLRRDLFKLIDETPNLDWLLLTKRPENIRKMWPRYNYDACATGDCPHERADQCGVILARENVWIGTSVENQEYADKRIPELLTCRDLSPVLFLSCEPLLGPVELWPIAFKQCPNSQDLIMCPETGAYECCSKCDYSGFSDEALIDWVIAGGESGTNARPSHPDWFRSLRDQCAAAAVPFHFKQWGEWLPASQGGKNGAQHDWENGGISVNVGKRHAGRLLDGVEWDGLPAK